MDSDLISRQAVKNLITMKPYDWSNITERRAMLLEIDKLPSAEPEVVKVRVMKDLNDKPVNVCECGAYLEGETFWKIAENYCPNCGRRLEWNEAENERPYQ